MIENHPILFCAVLAIIENFAIESMSRRSVLKCLKYIAKSPHVFIYNALIILLTLSICLLFRRRVFGIVLLSAPWLICGLINNVVLSYRVTPLGAIDFQIVKMSLILVYLTKTQRILLYCSVGLLAVAIVVLWIVGPKISGKLSYGKNVASIAGLVICVLIATNLGLNFKALSSDFGNIVGAYNDYGFVYCFSSSVIDTGIDKPSGYSGTTVSEELERLPAEKDASALLKPDIILIQLESFIDPKTIKGLNFSDDPAPVHTYLRENFTTGKLDVPSFGGGTANTEFEVLTGISLDYFGAGEYPYKTVMLEQTAESIPFNLKKLGYSAHAIHDHTGNFYDRDKVYPHLGFDTFQSKEYMYGYDTTPYGWCKDKALTGEIMTALTYQDEEKGITADTPRFVWTVSVQGHGSYPTEPIAGTDNVIKVTSDKFTSSEVYALQYYTNQVWEMDMFLGSLISAVENRGKPTLIIAYGDHLPAIGIDGDDLVNGDAYATEYVTWNNFGLEKRENKELYSYQLSSQILDSLGFNMGNLTRLHQMKIADNNSISDEQYQNDIHLFAYDMLYGDNFQFGGQKPFVPSAMKMGTVPVKIETVKSMGTSVYVQGTGFTDKSKIFINGVQCKNTVLLSQYSLMASDTEVNDGDEITVGQASSKREVLGYSESVIYDSSQHYIEETTE